MLRNSQVVVIDDKKPHEITVTTLVHRFWRHVGERPRKTGFIVQRPRKRKRTWRHPFTGDAIIDYQHMNWAQAGEIVAAMMVVLREEIGIKHNDRVAILSWNRPEWTWLALSAWGLGGIVVGIDPRFAQERVSYTLNDAHRSPADMADSGLKVIFCEDQEQADKVRLENLAAKEIKVVLIADLMKRLARPLTPASPETQSLFLLAHVVHSQIAMLLYTSGSTGDPKGVILTHGNLAYMSAAIPEKIQLEEDDLFFGQLPANHILAWNGQGPALWKGIPSFLCHPLEMKKHIKHVHPTVMIGVTKLWLMIMDELKAAPRNWLLAKGRAFVIGRAFQPEKSFLNRVLNKIVSWMLASALGGSLRLRISGGAAFPAALLREFEILRQRIFLGFGLSETTGCVTVETPEHSYPGSSGHPLDFVTLSFEQLPENAGAEIVISGPTISPGYWSRPELTAQVFRNDAFWTGDVGHLDHGCLVVEGRKGDDGKLLNGEKVSSQEIVEEFFANPMIQYVVPEFLNRPNVTALLFLNEPAAHAFLAQQGELSAPGSVESLATNKLIEAAVQAQIARINEKVGQKGQWKRIRQFRIVPTTPTTENRLLSGKGEISAKVAKKVYADLIEGMYP